MTNTLQLPEAIETLTKIIFSPVIIPVAEAVKQPVVQSVIKESMNFAQTCQEQITEFNGNLHQQHQQQSEEFPLSNTPNGNFEPANDVINVISDFNSDFERMTNGVADLRLLFPLALTILAMQQLLVKGGKLKDIPWYILAWFAFDSFIKLNKVSDSCQRKGRSEKLI
ncbi:DUF5132 domain-containing protein [Anabaena subtropica]|uniref:DUF5132 domain-containing protein n=1 Tax=Anabaena subtropica FACHB-260 TaxID=2692884 RepID=A0ABR8CJD8_9NOST|nr:DUF5132 domain-containing protein [Anabaena subtropica]MBD2342543.1 DUF5132 domain-containing protein [Anabaena subtropica FACHB-260]